ncbi:MAG: ABC transporter ATP-binding protein [Verrucomicrobiaceae bacterium]|nr:ABC transporter ATP-binding protein [Verrucomicrobiaceae bacterium]
MSASLLDLQTLRVQFQRRDAPPFEAVKGISLRLVEGESLAVVGESGSGKSVAALSLTRLLPEPPASITADRMVIDGHSVLSMSEKELRKVRGKVVSYVFQEPGTSLNPVLTVRTQLAESLKLHRPDVTDIDREIIFWLDRVGIVDPAKRLRAYPHELSGGMQQRVMIAMALCTRPKLLIADEPTTALDVTIQKQIMELLAGLRKELGMSLIIITHNLGIIREVADRVAVMFRGNIVEEGDVETILSAPQHPYTKALIDCIPRLGVKVDRLKSIDYAQLDALA